MQEFELAHYWMLGVMLIMGLFFVAAVIGHLFNKKKRR